MENLFSQNININSIEELDNIVDNILTSNNEYFNLEVGELEPIVFKFIGNRFNNEFIPIKATEILSIYKINFVKYYNNLLHTKIDENVLFFNFKRGSLEIDLQQIISDIVNKGINKMNGKHITLTVIFAIGAWFTYLSYDKYLETQKDKFNNDIAIKALEVLQQDITLRNAKNKPVNKALEILEDNEKLEYGNIKDKAIYSKNDADKFDITDDEQITYETITGNFYIKELKDKEGKKIVVLKKGKEAKFEAVSKLDDNSLLYQAFDKRQSIKLKIKIGKNNQGKIVEADIYELAE
jgi:hypothetical protein